jgi:hypothetical protein
MGAPMGKLLSVLGWLSLGVAVLAAFSMRSDIQFILLMLGVIGGILGLGVAAVLDRLDALIKEARSAPGA